MIIVEQPFVNGNTTAGTIGGTLLVLLFRINSQELIVSAVLAATGATVSFGVSVCLKFLMKWIRLK